MSEFPCPLCRGLSSHAPVCLENLRDFAVVNGQLIEADKIIEVMPPDICEFCDKEKETRPYGPGGKNICVPCFEGLTQEGQEEGKKRFFGEL